jgi:uncharacterized membrane protein
MRQLIIKTAHGQGSRALDLAREHGGQNTAVLETGPAHDLIITHVPNRSVGDLLQGLEKQTSGLEVTLSPQAIIPLAPPLDQVPDHVANVQPRSPVEIWLNAQQSVGPWLSFLGYAAAGSLIVWIAMYTNTIYLLVAAMLVSPFAQPAMNTALATAVGDKSLLRQSIGRYFGSLTLTILIAAALSLLLNLQTATNVMVSVSEVASVAVLLPLIAGAAGAMNLAQAENSSLVSGTAVGVLVAASLAPPAGLIGMAAAIQRWDMAVNGVFILLLQLVAINLAGALTFRVYGLRPQGAQFRRGHATYFYGSLLLSVIALAGLLVWQFQDSPSLQRSTRSQEALNIAEQALSDIPEARLIEANFRYTWPSTDQQGPQTLLGVVYVERMGDTTVPASLLEEQVVSALENRLLAAGFNAKPLINVSVLDPPPSFSAEN